MMGDLGEPCDVCVRVAWGWGGGGVDKKSQVVVSHYQDQIGSQSAEKDLFFSLFAFACVTVHLL